MGFGVTISPLSLIIYKNVITLVHFIRNSCLYCILSAEADQLTALATLPIYVA